MRDLLPDYDLMLKGLDRSSSNPSDPLVGGNGTVTFRPVPPGLIWSLDLISVAATLAGAPSFGAAGRVSLFRNSVADDNYIGTKTTVAADAAIIFDNLSGSLAPWLLGGESLLVRVTGATALSVVTVRCDYRIFELRPLVLPPWRGDTSGFPDTPEQGDDRAGAYDRPDDQDLYDRDPLVVGGPGSRPADRHALDGGIVDAGTPPYPLLPADPGAASGSDRF